MDLTGYFQKIRATEEAIADKFPVVVSLETADGGRGGTPAEVTRAIAAKMIVEGTARLATAEEAQAFREGKSEAKRAADRAAEAAKVQISVLPTSELDRLKAAARSRE